LRSYAGGIQQGERALGLSAADWLAETIPAFIEDRMRIEAVRYVLPQSRSIA